MLEEEAIKKGIDIEGLRAEQRRLAKTLSLKDEFDFDNATRFAGVDILVDTNNKRMIAAIVVLDEDLEPVEEKYAQAKISFPYIPGFRAYRELPLMVEVFKKLEEAPDVIFVLGHGIAHPRGFGIASHFGLAISKPTIGIAKKVLVGEEKNDEIILNNKVLAKAVMTKQGSKPIYVSQGNMISLDTAVKITKKCAKEPHKLPEPIVKTRRYLDRIRKTLV
jgi:deoxyribonuclease V